MLSACATKIHVPLNPAALVFVLFGIVLVRVRVRTGHGIDASAFLRSDWIVDEHSEGVSLLPERPLFA